MILNAIMGYVLAFVEDEQRKKERKHNGRHREGLPNRQRRMANNSKRRNRDGR